HRSCWRGGAPASGRIDSGPERPDLRGSGSGAGPAKDEAVTAVSTATSSQAFQFKSARPIEIEYAFRRGHLEGKTPDPVHNVAPPIHAALVLPAARATQSLRGRGPPIYSQRGYPHERPTPNAA